MLGFKHEPQSGKGKTNIWLTPPSIIKDLGPFDLDPCAAPNPRPWDTAQVHYTEGGLTREWRGFVWMNPPYGRGMGVWFARLSEHEDGGIALAFARTDTNLFFKDVWPKHTGVLFVKGRIKFHRPDGVQAGQSGAPSVLVGYGDEALRRLSNTSIQGHLVVNAAAIVLDAKGQPVETWAQVVKAALDGKTMRLRDIYSAAECTGRVRAAKARGHKWKAQIRRALQVYCRAINYGVWAPQMG